MKIKLNSDILRQRTLAAIVFSVILGFHATTLQGFPQLFVDEAWLANRAWWFLKTGIPFGTVDADFMMDYPGYWTYLPWLPTWVQSLPLRMLAVPKLLPLRLLSLLWGFVLLAAVYLIGLRLKGRRYALLTMALVAFSWPFCISAHWARADIMAAALGFSAIALYLVPNVTTFWPSLAAGFVVGLAFEMHPNAAIFGPVLVALSWARHGWSVWKYRDFWGVAVGSLIGVGLYAALHILPYPETYVAFSDIFFAVTHIPPVLTGNPYVVWQTLLDLGPTLFEMYPLVVLAIVGWVREIGWPNTSNRQVLVLSGALSLSYILWIRNAAPYYAILLTPALDLLVASVLLDESLRPWRSKVLDYVQRVLVWGLTLAALLRVWIGVQVNYYPDYSATQARINELVLPGERIMAAQTYWFGLYEHDYDSWEELIYYRRYQPTATLEESFAYYRPDIFIVDGHLDSFVRDDQGDTLYEKHLRLSRTELTSFLRERAQLVDEFSGGCYGWVRVYRLSWP